MATNKFVCTLVIVHFKGAPAHRNPPFIPAVTTFVLNIRNSVQVRGKGVFVQKRESEATLASVPQTGYFKHTRVIQ